jgi:hypothetical protein
MYVRRRDSPNHDGQQMWFQILNFIVTVTLHMCRTNRYQSEYVKLVRVRGIGQSTWNWSEYVELVRVNWSEYVELIRVRGIGQVRVRGIDQSTWNWSEYVELVRVRGIGQSTWNWSEYVEWTPVNRIPSESDKIIPLSRIFLHHSQYSEKIHSTIGSAQKASRQLVNRQRKAGKSRGCCVH